MPARHDRAAPSRIGDGPGWGGQPGPSTRRTPGGRSRSARRSTRREQRASGCWIRRPMATPVSPNEEDFPEVGVSPTLMTRATRDGRRLRPRAHTSGHQPQQPRPSGPGTGRWHLTVREVPSAVRVAGDHACRRVVEPGRARDDRSIRWTGPAWVPAVLTVVRGRSEWPPPGGPDTPCLPQATREMKRPPATSEGLGARAPHRSDVAGEPQASRPASTASAMRTPSSAARSSASPQWVNQSVTPSRLPVAYAVRAPR